MIYEKISKRDERVAYVENLYGKSIKLVSRSYNQGNIGAAFIDGIDYSENKRGLNFVIYDKVLTEVVDSVSFDTHSENNLYYRFGKAHHSLFEVSTKVERMRPWDTYVVPKEIKKEEPNYAELFEKYVEMLYFGEEIMLLRRYYIIILE